jgi:hypothetical protein
MSFNPEPHTSNSLLIIDAVGKKTENDRKEKSQTYGHHH